MSSKTSIDQIIQAFELLPEWEDRYRYLIDLGRKIPTLTEEQKTQENLLEGCVSQVWLSSKTSSDNPEIIHYQADSEAHIVRGLIGVALAIYDGKPAQEITQIDPQPFFAQLGLEAHLLPSRVNGLAAMVERIKELAQKQLSN